MNTKTNITFDVGNPGYGFGQEHKCGGDKLVNDITKTV
jgi:hypothetical protein